MNSHLGLFVDKKDIPGVINKKKIVKVSIPENWEVIETGFDKNGTLFSKVIPAAQFYLSTTTHVYENKL